MFVLNCATVFTFYPHYFLEKNACLACVALHKVTVILKLLLWILRQQRRVKNFSERIGRVPQQIVQSVLVM